MGFWVFSGCIKKNLNKPNWAGFSPTFIVTCIHEKIKKQINICISLDLSTDSTGQNHVHMSLSISLLFSVDPITRIDFRRR